MTFPMAVPSVVGVCACSAACGALAAKRMPPRPRSAPRTDFCRRLLRRTLKVCRWRSHPSCSLYLGFGRSQCGRSGRDRPFAPWSMLFAGDREKARVVAPTFRRSPNGCRGHCSFTEQARIRKAGPTPTERRSQAVNATQQGGVRVGIDVSKRTLDVCLLPEGESFVLPNDQQGVDELLSRLEDSPPNWSSSRPSAATSVWPPPPSRPPQSPSQSSTLARPATSPRPSADSPKPTE